MNKKGVFGLSWTALIGVIFALIFLVTISWYGIGYANILFDNSEKNLEDSMVTLRDKIHEVPIGESDKVLFYSTGDNLVLVGFNEDFRNPLECNQNPCLVLCNDADCDDVYYPTLLAKGIEFENPGEILSLTHVENNYIELAVENRDGKISVGLTMACTDIGECGDYENELYCGSNPCEVGDCYWRIIPKDVGGSVEVCWKR